MIIFFFYFQLKNIIYKLFNFYINMGFEVEVPPEPTREEEKLAIKKIEDSWLEQSNLRWY